MLRGALSLLRTAVVLALPAWGLCVSAAAEARSGPDEALLHRARQYASRQEFHLAVDTYRALLGDYPQHYRGWLELARIHRDQHRPCLATCEATRALRANPGWATAVELLESLPKRPRPEPRQALATVPCRIPLYDSATVSPSRTPEIEALFRTAVTQYEQRAYDRSLATVRAVLEKQPDHGGAYYYGGLIRKRRGENDKAEYNFVQGLRYPELGFNAHYYLSRMRAEQGDYACAIAHLRAYIRHTSFAAGRQEAEELVRDYQQRLPAPPDSVPVVVEQEPAYDSSCVCRYPPSWLCALADLTVDSALVGLRAPALRRAEALVCQRRWDDAAMALDEWLGTMDDSTGTTMALLAQGICLFRAGSMDRALEALERFLQRGDNYPEAAAVRVLAGYASAMCDRPDGALAMARQCTGEGVVDAVRWAAWMTAGTACAARGDWTGAADAFSRAAEGARSGERRALAKYELGRAMARQGRHQQAVALFDGVFSLSVADSTTTVACGVAAGLGAAWSLEQMGHTRRAVQMYERVAETFPAYVETPWALYRSAVLHSRMGDTTTAGRTLDRLSKEYAQDYWAGRPAF